MEAQVLFFCAGSNCPGLPYRASDVAHPPTCCASLIERVANALGWTLQEAQSFSFQALREVVRPVSAKLAHELDAAIRSGSYMFGLDAQALQEPFCACGHVVSRCDRSRKACRRPR